MKNYRILAIFTALFILVSGSVFSQNPKIEGIQDAAKKFSNDVAMAVPFNSTIGLNWSDAYIGQFPHFGIGFSVGFTTLGIDSIDDILDAAQIKNNIPSFLRNMGVPIPAYTIEARIGGFVLPFDIGVKLGMFPKMDFDDFYIDYLLFGFDVRYALIDNKLSPIKVSVGIGYNYLRGGFRMPIDDIDIDIDGVGTLNLTDTKFGFLWGTHCYELKSQISFKLPVITPYVGAGLSVAFSRAGYEFESTSSLSDDEIEALEELGIDINKNGFEYIAKHTTYNMRLFGGISLNLAVIRMDLTGMYNLADGNFGVTIAGRFQM